MNMEDLRTVKAGAPEPSETVVKEIERLKFVLDKSNRFPNLLSNEEMLKLARKLADLERRAHVYK